jgi:hypothetical protein
MRWTLLVHLGTAQPETPVIILLASYPKGILYRESAFVEPLQELSADAESILYHERLIHGSTP